jgi:hypothetical protein
MILFAMLVVLAAAAIPSTLAYGYYGSSNSYPPYGQYWGYDWGRSNYISPPIYLSYRGSDNTCVTGVRSAYWGGFTGCSSYQGNNVRPWSGGNAYSTWSNSYSNYGYGNTYRSYY